MTCLSLPGFRVIAESHRAGYGLWKLDLALPDGGTVEWFPLPDPPLRSL